jgi:hypothetical protein
VFFINHLRTVVTVGALKAFNRLHDAAQIGTDRRRNGLRLSDGRSQGRVCRRVFSGELLQHRPFLCLSLGLLIRVR